MVRNWHNEATSSLSSRNLVSSRDGQRIFESMPRVLKSRPLDAAAGIELPSEELSELSE